MSSRSLSTLILPIWLVLNFIPIAFGQDFTSEQINQIREQLPKTETERTFYHWTNKNNATRWINQKHINEGEIKFFNTPTGERQMYGPGFYVAEKPTSSKGFGEVAVAMTLKEGTPIYDEDVIEKVLGRALSENEMAVLGEHIPFIRNASGDWYVTNHFHNTSDIYYGAFASKEPMAYAADARNWNTFTQTEFLKDLVDQGDEGAIYLKKILNTSNYMDGISFARAMKVNPGAPWEEFEGYGLAQFENAVEKIKPLAKQNLVGTRSEYDKNFLKVFNALSGKDLKDVKDGFRTEGIRAGGDREGKTFIATLEQLQTMEKNPYLEVVSVKEGPDRYRVHYYYPDAFHYKKLEDRISPELFKKLEQYSSDELLQNQSLRQSLNKELLSELYDDVLIRLEKGQASWTDVISIHPFDDMNGRSIRMMQRLYSKESHFFLSDIDILVPLEKQYEYLQSGKVAHTQLQADLMDEFLRARTEKRMPDYLKTGAFEKFLNSALPMPMNLSLDSPEVLNMIQKREWVELIEVGAKESLNELSKKLKSASSREKALEDLSNVYFRNSRHYSLANKVQLMDILENEIHNAKSRGKKELFFRLYESLVQDPLVSAKAVNYNKIKDSIVNSIKTDLIKNWNYVEAFSIASFETDPIKRYNHLIDIRNQLKSTREKSEVFEILVLDYTTTLDNKFSTFAPETQHELLGKLQTIFATNDPNLKQKHVVSNLERAYKDAYEIIKDTKPKGIPNSDEISDAIKNWHKTDPDNVTCIVNLLKGLFP